MKRLLIPLVAALTLPTAVNAKTTYLSCEFNESRMFIGTQINEVLNSWRKSFGSYPVEFTLNENDQSGSIFYKNHDFRNKDLNNITAKIDFITFQPESIVISVVPIKNASERVEEKYSISRVDGTVYRKIYRAGGDIRNEYMGTCKKSEPKKTLF